jgi:hypothetical protein
LTLNAGSAAGTAESPNEPPLARHSTASVFLTPPKPTPALPGCSPTPTRSTCTRIGRQGLNVVTGSQENGLEIVRMQRRT